MTERPILFSGPMVRAILAGTKTQTRRVVKPQPEQDARGWIWRSKKLDAGYCHTNAEAMVRLMEKRSPYGQPGDRLWVRETSSEQHPLAVQEGRYSQLGRAGIPGPPPVTYRVIYRADGEPAQVWRRDDNEPPYFTLSGPADDVAARHPTVCSNFTRDGKAIHWTPAIFMPRWACRLVLEVTDVRVDRLQSISPEDAQAEGVTVKHDDNHLNHRTCFVEEYERLWDSLNFKRAPWASNPWVWVVEFRRCTSTTAAKG